MESNKEILVEIFRKNIKGKVAITDYANQRHDGRNGHWLERQFGILANAYNTADILGFELKNETNSKTTFGDWSANRYIFKDGEYCHLFERDGFTKQDIFCEIFGKSNIEKNGRYSWSGSPSPKIDIYNDFGQVLYIDSKNDIYALYSYSMDKRLNKDEIVPAVLHREGLVLAQWFGMNSPTENRKDKCLKRKLEDKFNDAGWFTCKTDAVGKYERICFGLPMNFQNWIGLVHLGIVFFDSGMYQGNNRPYSQWRANNEFWDSIIIDSFD